jgi:membrane fusion protein, adhesin transport system
MKRMFNKDFDQNSRYLASVELSSNKTAKRAAKVFIAFFIITFALLFFPWTQNVQVTGNVITLRPEQKPQPINSIIAGKIARWYVREGQMVEKGDTILYLEEVSDKYLDTLMVQRLTAQVDAKQQAVDFYKEKISSQNDQLSSLLSIQKLKFEQAKNKLEQNRLKVITDSMNVVAAETDLNVAQLQFNRFDTLYRQGLKSLTELEGKKLKLQETQAKYLGSQNKLLTTRNEFLNAEIEMTGIMNEYQEKIFKTESEQFSAFTDLYQAEGDWLKLRNELSNIEARGNFYFITSPQSGLINRTIASGLGEFIKAGETVAQIVPTEQDLVLELFVRPVDLPLVHAGGKARVQFDGWPALVFSGWPSVTQGTYGAEVIAVDKVISPNGKFRILVAPDKNEVKWPDAIRVGSGTNAWIMLKNVPVWYELWRQFNGFPPEFYTPEGKKTNNDKNQGEKGKDEQK